jgi:hypothetical protein
MTRTKEATMTRTTTAKILEVTAEQQGYDLSEPAKKYTYDVYQITERAIYVPEEGCAAWLADDAWATCHGNDQVTDVRDTGRTVELTAEEIRSAARESV